MYYNKLVTPVELDNVQWDEFPEYNNYYCLLLETWKQECCFFGLNDDGNLVAYVRQGFNFIDLYTFPVGLMYGHLVVRYWGVITPFFKKFLAGNRFVQEKYFNLADNVDAMRCQYTINNLHWDRRVEEYWRKLFENLYNQVEQYTPGNTVKGVN